MILAELEVYHSRPVAPTRRVALGASMLPTHPAPGFGGILLGGVAATYHQAIDPEMLGDLRRLTLQLEHGQRIAQPRLRHRFQTDRIGLTRSALRLRAEGQRVRFDFDDKAAPAQYVLAAVYAAGRLEPLVRPAILETVRRGLRWTGSTGPGLIDYLSGAHGPGTWSADALADPVAWALAVLGLGDDERGPDQQRVQRRFRALLRAAHPDHGARAAGAAERIAELTAARRILLSSS